MLTPKSNRCPDPAEHKFGTDDDGLSENGNPPFGKIADQNTTVARNSRKQFTGPAGSVLWRELYEMASLCLGYCLDQSLSLNAGPGSFSDFKKLMELTTGLTVSEKNIQNCAYRSHAIERFFNLRESEAFRQKQGRDHGFEFPVGMDLPQQMQENFDLKRLKRLVSEYYRLNGWDKAAILKLKIFNELKISELWPLMKPKGGR